MALPKDSGCSSLRPAFKAIMEDGTYQEILKKWNLSDAAIPAPLINGEPLAG